MCIVGMCVLKAVSVQEGQMKISIPLKLKIQLTASCLPLVQEHLYAINH